MYRYNKQYKKWLWRWYKRKHKKTCKLATNSWTSIQIISTWRLWFLKKAHYFIWKKNKMTMMIIALLTKFVYMLRINLKQNINILVNLFQKIYGGRRGQGGSRGVQIDPHVVFWKMYLLKRGWNPGFLWLLILF